MRFNITTSVNSRGKSMLTVQNYRITPNRVSFKGEGDESSQSQAPKPYQTKAGLKTGAAYAAVNTAIALGVTGMAKKGLKFTKEVAEEIDDTTVKEAISKGTKEFTKASKKMWITIPIGILVSLGCGAIVDNLINKKNKLVADKLAAEGKKAALDSDDRADITKKENVYYRSNKGKTIGTLLGVVAYPALLKTETLISKVKSPIGIVGAVVTGALGGLILGSITDKCANNAARKYVDKQNM